MIHHYLKGVATLKFFSEKCTGCGRCTEVCPHAVFTLENRKAVLSAPEFCIECGACVQNCAFDALSVQAGVGCAAAMINGIITKGDPDLGTCDCSADGGCC